MPIDGTHNEQELLMRISQGDRTVFKSLYTSYFAYVQRYISLFEPSGNNLDELTQDVFIRIWENVNTWSVLNPSGATYFLLPVMWSLTISAGLKVQQKVKELEEASAPGGNEARISFYSSNITGLRSKRWRSCRQADVKC